MDGFTKYFRIADITIKVSSDIPINNQTFDPKFATFQVDLPGDDIVHLHHHFELPSINEKDLGKEIYHKAPWKIYQQNNGWIYLGFLPEGSNERLWKIAKFSVDYERGTIYHPSALIWEKGGLGALTSFPSDQILISQLLAYRDGFYVHSAGAILNKSGILFVGHSQAGKSTITKMLLGARYSQPVNKQRQAVEILCDDRNIVRKTTKGWRVYGSWSHGDIPDVSAASAPLRAICFLEKATDNKLIPLQDRFEIFKYLLACIIKPFITRQWWQQTLDLTESLAAEVPAYQMRFNKSGEILKYIDEIVVTK